MGVKGYTGKLYQISEDRGWNHVVFDMNPNDELSLPVAIIEPGDVFLAIDAEITDYWFHFEDVDFANQMCIKILYGDVIGWIMVLPEDIIEVR